MRNNERMRIFLFLFLFVAAECSASAWIGAGPGILVEEGSLRSSTSGYVVSIEITDPKYVSSLAHMNRVNVRHQYVFSIQRKFGRRIYFSIGPGITKATSRNSRFNICGGLGAQSRLYSVGWTHCSNGNTHLPNLGIDFFQFKRRI